MQKILSRLNNQWFLIFLSAVFFLLSIGGSRAFPSFNSPSPLKWTYFLVSLGFVLLAIPKRVSELIFVYFKKLNFKLNYLSKKNKIVVSFCFTLFYIFCFIIFKQIDFWNHHFSGSADVYIYYAPLRLCHLMFFMLSLLGFSHLLFKTLKVVLVPNFQNFIIQIMVGAALLNFTMFILGILNLYYNQLIAPLTCVIVFAGTYIAVPYVSYILNKIEITIQNNNLITNKAHIVLGFLFFLMATLVLIIFGMSAHFNDYDVPGHYLPYFKSVIESHGLAPNELWYHFFMSKGYGLFIYLMMQTDLIAGQMVSFFFLLMTSFIFYTFTRKYSVNRYIAILGALAIIRYPTSTNFNLFFKSHIAMMAFVTFIVWVCVEIFSTEDKIKLKQFFVIILVTMLGVTTFTPTLNAYILPFLSLLMLFYFFKKKYFQFKIFLVTILASAATLISILVYNYVVAGMAEATPFRFFFRAANQDILKQWVSPYLVLYLSEATSPTTGEFLFSKLFTIDLNHFLIIIPFYLNKYIFFNGNFVYAFLLIIAAMYIYKKKLPKPTRESLPLFLFLFSVFLILQIVRQPQSLERYFTFLGFYVLFFGAIVWQLFLNGTNWNKKVILIPLVIAISIYNIVFTPITSNALSMDYHVGFLKGRQTLSQAFFKFVPPLCLNLSEELPNSKFLHITTASDYVGCGLVPNNKHEIEMSYSLGKEWHKSLSQDPAEIKKWLQGLDFKYFLVDEKSFILGCIGNSALFTAQNLRYFFQVKKHIGSFWILEWRNSGTLDKDFLEFEKFWTHKIQNTETFSRICDRVRYYYYKFGTKEPLVIDPTLPHLQGWQ